MTSPQENWPSTNLNSTMTVIDAGLSMRWVDLRELWRYRDLFWFLTLRDVKVRYAQSVLGVGWAVLQPLLSMVVFTVIFGNFVKMSSDGVPYAIFNFTALVPWLFFSSAVTEATGSLVKSSNMLTKIYFPRLVIPFSSVIGKLIDFSMAMFFLVFMLFAFQISLRPQIIIIPFLVLLMIVSALGIGIWLTALAIRYRDINYAVSFIVQVLLYVSPVVYSVREVPQQLRLLYGINPMAGVIDGFRAALLNTGPIPWDLIGVGTLSALFFFITGVYYFTRMERTFADVA